MSDTDIATLLTDALQKINEYVHAYAIYYLTTVAGQAEYTPPTGVRNVIFVSWAGASHDLSDVFGDGFGLISPDSREFDVETGIYYRLIRALNRKLIDDSFSWNYLEEANQITLMPPPSTAGTRVYYLALLDWTLGSAPARFEKHAVMYCTAEALKIVARRRRRESAVAHTGGTPLWQGSDPTLQDARAIERKFQEEMQAESRKAFIPLF